MNNSFPLARGGCETSASGAAGSCPNKRALTAAECGTEQGARCRPTPDLGEIAFGVTLAFQMIGGSRDCHHVSVEFNGSEANSELAGSVEASAGFGIRDFTSYRRTGLRNRLAVNNQVSR